MDLVLSITLDGIGTGRVEDDQHDVEVAQLRERLLVAATREVEHHAKRTR